MAAGLPSHLMLFRKYVSRKAAGKGRALLEGVGLFPEEIAACYINNPLNEEETVQVGLVKWAEGQGIQPPTWELLLQAMDYAQIAVQHRNRLKEELGSVTPRPSLPPLTGQQPQPMAVPDQEGPSIPPLTQQQPQPMAIPEQAPMSPWNDAALVSLQEALKLNVIMPAGLTDILEKPAGGFMNRMEALSVSSMQSNFEQMGQLIGILRGKGNSDFHIFCDMLRKSNNSVWARELEKEAEKFKKQHMPEREGLSLPPHAEQQPQPIPAQASEGGQQEPPDRLQSDHYGMSYSGRNLPSAEEVLKEFRNQFVNVVEADAVAYDLQERNIISQSCQEQIAKASGHKHRNQILHTQLVQGCTREALIDACDIFIAEKGYPQMNALGEAMKEKLEREGPSLLPHAEQEPQPMATPDQEGPSLPPHTEQEPQPTPDEVGPLEKWTTVERIGRGRYSDVFLYKDVKTGQQRAVKVVHFDPNNQKKIRHLQSEIKILKDLQHERIVTYFGTVQRESMLYIFLEYMPRGSLHELVQKESKLSEELTRKYTRQILEGVAYLHGQNKIHMDIKGANILLDSDGNIKLADFGVSKQLQTVSSGYTTMSAKGTWNWMAPEVMEEESKTTLKADIWSVGCTVVEMLTGNPPLHELNTAQVIRVVTNKPEKVCPGLPPPHSEQANDFLSKCFKAAPEDRMAAVELLDLPFLKE